MRSPTFNERKASSTLFQRGDRVEIVSNEEGFEGSYYPASIITWLVNEDYIIRYNTLLNESGFEHVREVVSADQIRPRPPNVEVKGFSVGDEVDAYDNDGWWFGKIIRIIGSKYLVYFEGSEEENAYPLSSLRVHQEWVDGSWVSSIMQKASSALFQRGDRVEIVSNEEGLKGSYYPANIITWLVNEDYIIRYKTLVDEGGFEHVREVVSVDQIRPLPPNVVVKGFSLGDEVDAYDNDGWWFGKITRKIGSKYLVYFEGSEEENAYPLSSLRVHQEWVDGGWVSSIMA